MKKRTREYKGICYTSDTNPTPSTFSRFIIPEKQEDPIKISKKRSKPKYVPNPLFNRREHLIKLNKNRTQESRDLVAEKLRGRKRSDEVKQKMSEFHKGTKFIYSESENICRKVPKEDVQSFLDKGWKMGKLYKKKIGK